VLRFIRPWIAIAAAPVLMDPAEALEKRAAPFDPEGSQDWNAGGECISHYYNICTGWVWCWSGFGDDFRLGVVVNAPQCVPGALLQTTHFICTAAPSGYGFTGTIAVHNVDANNCPTEPPIASQPFLPAPSSGQFQAVFWGGPPVSSKFAVIVQTNEEQFANPAAFGTDHPAAGPTGPAACGTCYPSTRPTHSFGFGTVASPICPGTTFNDGVCNAELFWDIDVAVAVSVEESSWGSIKALYR